MKSRKSPRMLGLFGHRRAGRIDGSFASSLTIYRLRSLPKFILIDCFCYFVEVEIVFNFLWSSSLLWPRSHAICFFLYGMPCKFWLRVVLS